MSQYELTWSLLYSSLRLQVYRSLGIAPEFDEAGIFNKVVVTNRRDGVDVIHIDSGLHPSQYANRLWSYIGE